MNVENLAKLFLMLDDDNARTRTTEMGNLFEITGEKPNVMYQTEENDLQFILNYYSGNLTPPLLNEPARLFRELSADAFDIFIHGWMSELPIQREILAFGRNVITAGKTAASHEEKRKLALTAALNRSDPDTLVVLNAATKVQFEIHRMRGLLRFSPDKDGVYSARCAPDHLILPTLAEYLTERFGDTAWTVIDEKRRLRLSRKPPEQAKIAIQETSFQDTQQSDEWEELWKRYHKTINNENRKNTGLQRQLMPKRYWKYLPEM